MHMPSFHHPCPHACPCLSVPAHTAIRPHCNYRWWQACVRAPHASLFCLCPCLLCSSVPACTVVHPCGCGGKHACTCAVCLCPCLLLFVHACAHCRPSLFICARLHSFAGPHLSLAVCVCSVVFVPTTWLCLFGFHLCLLVFTWVYLCSFSLCLHSFGLVYA